MTESGDNNTKPQDYKGTINLPKTAFSMKANLPHREPLMLKKWKEMNLYARLRQEREGAASYMFLDGPPYANGKIHVGHAVNKILKDMVVKAKSLSGLNAPFIPTWDCHGLPIEVQVEKKVGKVGKDIDAAAFRAKCRDYAMSQVSQQREDFQRLGVLADWAHPSLTMDFSYEANELRELATIIDRGHLHKGFRPVHWCPLCASSLAEAEVEYQDKTSMSIDVCFNVVDQHKMNDAFQYVTADQHPMSVLIWTTTPWTLPANMAVTVGPDIDYALVYYEKAHQKGLLIVAKARIEQVFAKVAHEQHEVLATCTGNDLSGMLLEHPLDERHVPILTGDHVNTESGTGLVHTAPAHGVDDFNVAKANHILDIINPVGPGGCFFEDTPLVGGEFYSKANPIIIAKLKEKHTLWHDEPYQHSYPHCWRHKKSLIFRATPQWFLSMSKANLGEAALAATEQVTWIPASGKVRMQKMLEHRPDWCISRQRTWGVPIALFTHKKTGERHPDTVKLMHDVADVIAKEGIDGWFSREVGDFLSEDAALYEKSHDILDVWFDSGSSHYCLLEQDKKLSFPADLYLEGSDQHRGWFQTSLLTAIARCGQSPYKKVLTHGFVVDAKGHKMSKSLGNIIAPQDIVKSLGADVLRLWVASIDYHTEIHLSDEILSRTADIYRRLRNTARFLLGNVADFNPDTDMLPYKDLLFLDQWAIYQAYDLQQSVQQGYDNTAFNEVTQALHRFSAIDMGGFYLDVLKDRLYTCQANANARRSAQTAIYHILECLVRCLSPILSFTADEIWQNMPAQSEPSVFLSKWYDQLNYCAELDPTVFAPWSRIQAVRDEVNKAIEKRRDMGEMGSSLEADVTVYAQGDDYTALAGLGEELRFVLITSKAKVLPFNDTPDDAEKTSIDGVCLSVNALDAPKCIRCYHRDERIGADLKHPSICPRCIINVSTEHGEVRQYA